MLTSRALTGSSARINSGFSTRALAIAILWRWPPENSCGYKHRQSSLKPTFFIFSLIISRISFSEYSVLICNGSFNVFKIFILGSRLEYGFWKTICALFLKVFSSFFPIFRMFLFLKLISPDFEFSSLIIAFARVDFPQPDSPANARISPCFISRLTPFTAWIISVPPTIPLFDLYSTYKSFISIRFSLIKWVYIISLLKSII